MYPPLHLGGYELIWESAVEHLRAAGHEVDVLTTDHGIADGGHPPGDDPGVHRELRWYWRDHEFPRLPVRKRLTIERHNARVMARLLGERDPEVVSWWSMGGMSLSLIEAVRREGRRSCAVLCDDWLAYAPVVDGWTRAFSHRPRLGRVAEVTSGVPTRVDLGRLGPSLFLSETVRRRALAEHDLPDTEVAYQGIPNPKLFAEREPGEWAWRLAYVGRIDPRKGIDVAILALEMLPPEATLRVVGPGDERHLAELRELAAGRGMGARVQFDRVPREALPDVYAATDAILFPVQWPEPWGLVPLEAMAVGRPVVATGRGGSGEYLADGENCLIYEPADDPIALAEAVRRLAAQPDLRDRVRAGGRETAARFSEEGFNRAVGRLVERAAGDRR